MPKDIYPSSSECGKYSSQRKKNLPFWGNGEEYPSPLLRMWISSLNPVFPLFSHLLFNIFDIVFFVFVFFFPLNPHLPLNFFFLPLLLFPFPPPQWFPRRTSWIFATFSNHYKIYIFEMLILWGFQNGLIYLFTPISFQDMIVWRQPIWKLHIIATTLI